MSALTRVALQLRIERAESSVGAPVVATTAGFVTFGAELLAIRETSARGPEDRRTSRLELAPPGTWFDSFRERQYPTGRGRPWWIRSWHPATRTH